MSGTSMDAVDAVILSVEDKPRVIEAVSVAFPKQLHRDISALITTTQTSLSNLGYLDVALAQLYSCAVNELLKKAGIHPGKIMAIGCHGQTVFHQPDGEYRFSTQLGSGSYIAELTGITTVCDFRNRDIAAGGQGAPLVPPFHQVAFGSSDEDRLIINIGGIANCSWIPMKGSVIGFDIGPGNTLMDNWILHSKNLPYDKDGQWAAKGNICQPLLNQLLEDDFFHKPPPKSSGREYFNLDWVYAHAEKMHLSLKPEDMQATLLQLTALTIANIINHFKAPHTYYCGGGSYNTQLLHQIAMLCDAKISDIRELGMDPGQVEAAAFAWLAKCCIHNETGSLSAVTGAMHEVIKGAIYPA